MRNVRPLYATAVSRPLASPSNTSHGVNEQQFTSTAKPDFPVFQHFSILTPPPPLTNRQ